MYHAPMPSPSLRSLPSVDRIVSDPALGDLSARELLTAVTREALDDARTAISDGGAAPAFDELLAGVRRRYEAAVRPPVRRVINKDFSDDRIVEAARAALSQGMQHVKMYFLCGLPTETDEDVMGMAHLALRIRTEVMLPYAKLRGRMGRISLSVNPFVPKPWTPFQWMPMHDRSCLEGKRKLLERTLRPHGIDVDFLSPREAYVQTLLSRGDRRLADLLELAHRETGGDVRKALSRWEPDPDFFVLREAGLEETLPWDFIDQGLTRRYLARELERGVGARLTPKCAVETCRACGLACAEHPELRPVVDRPA